jgi:TonB-dependent receptor
VAKNFDAQFPEELLSARLKRIGQQGNATILFDPKTTGNTRVVALEATNITVEEALERSLSATPFTWKKTAEKSYAVIKKTAEQQPKKGKGSISGTILDEAGESLTGASVVIKGTTIGTTSNLDGNYTLEGIAPGTYTIEVSYIGYQKRQFNKVKVKPGQTTSLDIKLTPASEDIGEVEVHGKIDKSKAVIRNTSEVSLINSIRTSDLMVTGISSEQISKSLDRDASDVVRRAPGVSMLSNFVLVRGMAPRYTKTYINGMEMSSSESFQRAFSFDLIPSGVIDAVDIYRMPAPELPGGFGGGIIKVRTKQSQTARRFQINISGDYDTDNSFKDLYTGSNESDKDWYGFGGNDRAFLSDIKGLENYNYNVYPEKRMALLKTMRPVNDLEKSRHTLNRSLGLNYYDSWLIGGVRINNLTSLNYSYKREAHNNYRFYYSDLVNNGENDKYLDGGIERLDSISVEKVRLNALESINIVINDNHWVGFNFFANRNANDANSMSPRATAGSAAYRLSDSIPKDIGVQYSYKLNDLYSGQLSGSHRFGKHEVEWSYGRSKFKSYVPDQEIFDFQYNKGYDAYSFYFALPTASSGDNTRSSYTIEEKGENATLDYVFALNRGSKLKAGGAYMKQNRTSVSHDYFWQVRAGSYTESGLVSPWLNMSEFLGPDLYDATGASTKDFVKVRSNSNNYSYDNKIWAAYLAWKQSFFDQKLELYGGLRYEYEYAQLFDAGGNAVTQETTRIGSETIVFDLEGPWLEYWLPSVSLSWNLSEKQKLRAGYGKTIDRAFARERSLGMYQSVEEGKLYIGNKVLRNARLDNVDLRWEYYPSETEFIAAGLFYKHIDKPIENFEWESSHASYVLAVNYKKADLYGAEIEIRKNLGFIPVNWADRFSFIANISYSHTKLENSYYSKGTLQWTEKDSIRSDRPMTGTTPFLVNANLYYTDPNLKTQVSVNYNYTGQMLQATGDIEFGYLYQNPHNQLDFTIIQPFGKHIALKAGVQNLLKKDITGWRDRDFDGELHPDEARNPGYKPDIDNAMRISTLRKIYLGLKISF